MTGAAGRRDERVEARFLTGEFIAAGDFAASPTGGTFSAGDRVSVDAIRPAAARRRDRAEHQPAAAGTARRSSGVSGRGDARACERADLVEAAAYLAPEDPHDVALAERRDPAVAAQRDVVDLALPDCRTASCSPLRASQSRRVPSWLELSTRVAVGREERGRHLVLVAAQHEVGLPRGPRCAPCGPPRR